MAAKKISQETFNTVVKENVEEFGLSPEEAIQDAKEQFDNQGVDLSGIVMSESVIFGGMDGHPEHPALEKLATLHQQIYQADDSESKPTLKDPQTSLPLVEELRDMLASDQDVKTLFATKGAFSLLLALVEASMELEEQISHQISSTALQALSLLLDGQPDLVTPPNPDMIIAEATRHPHIVKLVSTIKAYQGTPDVQQHGIKAVKNACIKHETNRQSLIAEGLVDLLIHVIKEHTDHPSSVAEAAHCLRALTLDDDVRVAFGKAHDHAKLIVTEHSALKHIISAIACLAHHEDTLVKLCSTLACLAVRNEFCQEIVDQGALELLLPILSSDDANSKVVSSIFLVIQAAAGNDKVKMDLCTADGPAIIVSAMDRFPKKLGVSTKGCACVTAMCLRSSENARAFVAAGIANTLSRAMVIHAASDKHQKEACRAIRNLAARNVELHDQILKEGVENAVRQAMKQHEECHDDGKAALRDLGCKVELREVWTGAPRDTTEEIS